jgi:MFS transporter, Spinster family, sphingosine-1-phosphate transporter
LRRVIAFGFPLLLVHDLRPMQPPSQTVSTESASPKTAVATDAPAGAVVSQARASLILLLLINLMNYVDRQILAAVEKPIGEEYGVGPDMTGWLVPAFLFAYMIFSPLFGVLADRMRRWAIVGIGVILWSLASGGSGAVQTFTLLIVMRLLIGVGEAAYGPVAPTIIADLYPVANRGKVLAWFYAAIPVGSALGYVIGGMFYSHWHWAFYATVPPGILLGTWCFMMREPKREGMAAHRRATLRDYLSLAKIPSYVINTAAMTAMTFAIGGIGFFMPRYLEEVGGLNPSKSTPIFGAIAASAGLFATIAGGIAGDKLRTRLPGSYFLVSACGMLVGFPLTLLMLVTPFPYCWGVIFLAVFCLFFNTGPSNTAIANVTPPTVRATAFALNILVIHALGDAISPPIIGWVAKHWGLKTGFAVVSVLMAIGGVIWLVGAKYLQRDTERASAG